MTETVTINQPKLGDHLFVKSVCQASANGASSPGDIYPAIVTQVFPRRAYFNVAAFSGQPVGVEIPAPSIAFFVGSVTHVSIGDSDNVWAWTAEELEA